MSPKKNNRTGMRILSIFSSLFFAKKGVVDSIRTAARQAYCTRWKRAADTFHKENGTGFGSPQFPRISKLGEHSWIQYSNLLPWTGRPSRDSIHETWRMTHDAWRDDATPYDAMMMMMDNTSPDHRIMVYRNRKKIAKWKSTTNCKYITWLDLLRRTDRRHLDLPLALWWMDGMTLRQLPFHHGAISILILLMPTIIPTFKTISTGPNHSIVYIGRPLRG